MFKGTMRLCGQKFYTVFMNLIINNECSWCRWTARDMHINTKSNT